MRLRVPRRFPALACAGDPPSGYDWRSTQLPVVCEAQTLKYAEAEAEASATVVYGM